MELLQDKGRDYRRYRPSPDEKIILANNGLQYVLSSNVSAVATDGDDLIIRFINGSLYSYPNRGHLINDILRSNSKGRWVHQHLRKGGVTYSKIGSLPLKSDIPLEDSQIFADIEKTQKNIEKLIGNQQLRKDAMFAGVVLGKGKPNYSNPLMDLAVSRILSQLFTPLK